VSPRTPASGDPTITIGEATPPARKRQRKITLPAEVLDALQTAISPEKWTGNGLDYDGEDGAKNATTAARIYRRDLARHMSISERKIKTRVWESEDGKWRFALQMRNENGNGGS